MLSRVVASATKQDWNCLSLVARDYRPDSDTTSALDWSALLAALGDGLSFQQPQSPTAADPDWLRVPHSPKDVRAFPELTTHAQ